MKHLLLTTIAAVMLVGCGESQQSGPQAEPVEHIAEAAKLEPPTAETPDTSILGAAFKDIEVVKQHLDAGGDVNVKDESGRTALLQAALFGHKEIAELLIAAGADVNAKDDSGWTPLDRAISGKHPETADLLRKHGGKTGAELKAEGK